jgi:hypothetical protein
MNLKDYSHLQLGALKGFEGLRYDEASPEPVATGAEYASAPYEYNIPADFAAFFPQKPAIADKAQEAEAEFHAARAEACSRVHSAIACTVGQARATLLTKVGGIETANSLPELQQITAELMQEIGEALRGNNGETMLDAEAAAQQEREQLWGEIAKLDEDIETRMRRMHDRGEISDEDYAAWQKKNAAANAMSDNDPRKPEVRAQATEAATQATKNAPDSPDKQAVSGDAEKVLEDTKRLQANFNATKLSEKSQAAEDAQPLVARMAEADAQPMVAHMAEADALAHLPEEPAAPAASPAISGATDLKDSDPFTLKPIGPLASAATKSVVLG